MTHDVGRQSKLVDWRCGRLIQWRLLPHKRSREAPVLVFHLLSFRSAMVKSALGSTSVANVEFTSFLLLVHTPIGWLCTTLANILVFFSLVGLECVGTLLRTHTPIGWLFTTQVNKLVFASLVRLECVGTLWELVGTPNCNCCGQRSNTRAT
jgi:hypothetical protein